MKHEDYWHKYKLRLIGTAVQHILITGGFAAATIKNAVIAYNYVKQFIGCVESERNPIVAEGEWVTEEGGEENGE